MKVQVLRKDVEWTWWYDNIPILCDENTCAMVCVKGRFCFHVILGIKPKVWAASDLPPEPSCLS